MPAWKGITPYLRRFILMWGSCHITWYLYCKIIFFRSFVYVYIFPVIIFYILHVFITCKTFALLTSESAVHDQTVTINDECTDCYGAYLTMVPPSLMSVSTWRKLLNTATTTNKGGFRLRGFTTHWDGQHLSTENNTWGLTIQVRWLSALHNDLLITESTV